MCVKYGEFAIRSHFQILAKPCIAKGDSFRIPINGVKCLLPFGKLQYFEKRTEDLINVKDTIRGRYDQGKCKQAPK
jgi:hypothetical protein